GSIELKLHDMVRAAKSSEHCTIKMAKDNATPRFSIFRNKRMRGWWPFIKLRDQEDDKREERDSDIFSLQGKVEAEFQLLTVEEADKSPVGLGRKGPE
ncbi:FR1L4 protein, partial [Dryoscopus gambensis]|nr:FR1L4 protein [Dryoscopus gambensis]